MRAPFCNDSTDLCPDEKGIIESENEGNGEIQPIEKSLSRGQNTKSAVFGICLEELMGTSSKIGPRIPFILSRLCQYIETHGLHQKKLFLEADDKSVESLKIDFIEYGDAPLETIGSVASAAKLLIIFFQELPEPVISGLDQSHFIEEMERLSISSESHLSCIKDHVERLPDPSYQVLKYLSHFLLKIACHEEYNGMSSDSLAVIFVPLIFRPTNEPIVHEKLRSIVKSLVQNYHAIFEKSCQKSITASEKLSSCRQLCCPSSTSPISNLSPLSVEIPLMDANSSESPENIPLLLIERTSDASEKEVANLNLISSHADQKSIKCVSRKRKERRLSGEDSQPRSSSEERPSLLELDKIDQVRRCSSHEEVVEGSADMDIGFSKHNQDKEADSYLSDTLELVINEKNHSPHPPNAKRREVDAGELNRESSDHWKYHNMAKFSDLHVPSRSADAFLRHSSKQNPVAESPEKSNMECEEEGEGEGDEFQDSKMAAIPRSASCPVPCSENDESESENSSLSMSWSMLFEDSEPVRAQNPLNWSPSKHAQDDALLSPSVHHLRNSGFDQAPLSPSAFRSYLSHRSSHLDPSVPPSPPVEQEDFAKKLVETSSVSESIRTLTKKIHSIKRRLRKFDDKFEVEFGYKPSHAEKSNNPEARKMLNDLYKARKELKALKEEAHLETVSPSSSSSWHSSVLGDSTNQLQEGKAKPSVEDSFGSTLKSLSDERRHANRPETVDDMTTSQVKDEKLAIQKALLHFESIHGKLKTKEERNTIRPLYERYRNVKKLLVRSGSFPVPMSKNKDLCSELQPILEHETMDFPSRELRSSQEEEEEDTNEETVKAESENCDVKNDEETEMAETISKFTGNSSVLTSKYDNSNFHELPLSEMIFQMQKVKSEKRHLRKILKEFETEFQRLNGRKVQKEDKAPVDTLYGEYKHVKARLKLLEALISKHDQHQLM